jgi:hypothetical protein
LHGVEGAAQDPEGSSVVIGAIHRSFRTRTPPPARPWPQARDAVGKGSAASGPAKCSGAAHQSSANSDAFSTARTPGVGLAWGAVGREGVVSGVVVAAAVPAEAGAPPSVAAVAAAAVRIARVRNVVLP